MTLFGISQAFEEFVQTFDEEPATSKGKVWVKAGTFNAGTRGKKRSFASDYVCPGIVITTREYSHLFLQNLVFDKVKSPSCRSVFI